MKLTRRQLAAAAIAPAALAAAPQQPAPPADELKAAKDRLWNTVAPLYSVALPMSTEPAFQFKAG